MSGHARILVLGPIPDGLLAKVDAPEVVRAENFAEAESEIAKGGITAVATDVPTATNLLARAKRNDLIYDALDEGIAVLDLDGKVTWANPVLEQWCGGDPTGQLLLDALGRPQIATDVSDPFAFARSGHSTSFQLVCQICSQQQNVYIEIRLRPARGPDGAVQSIIALTRNVTPEVEQQKRLDALHQAGRDLSSMEADQLAEMNLPTRVELLKQNLRKTIHDLLHYDIIEVRILDRRTGELKPLLEEGMTAEASVRPLYALPENNGVTGYVAYTGNSYVCPDASNDPYYILGATGARSSMTVPLKYFDEVIGTLNFESPRIDGFSADDLQFTELFSKEIATALHNLDLLSAQQTTAASKTIEEINKEIALPVDDLLAAAARLSVKLSTTDPAASTELKSIMMAARRVKAGVKKVGDEYCPVNAEGSRTTVPGAPSATGSYVPPLVGKRVLVIDPDERMRKQAHLLLGRLGAECESSSTAAAGLALFADDPYDAVFLDIRPPDASAYTTYCQLRDLRPKVQVAMTTGFGYDAGHSIVKARQDGMQFTLFKPFRPEQVVKTVTTPPLPRGTPAPSAVVGLS
ncbi:MAG: GAF domain-containing protein [Gemmataceae bacterium]